MDDHYSRIGAVELGGTKVNVGIGTADGQLLGQAQLPTREPEETLSDIAAYFATVPSVAAIGVGSFGPIDVDPASCRFGRIGRTPKPGWSGVDVLAGLRRFDLPLFLDTDVNAAALGEHRWGAARGLDVAIYLTIGTGIGGGLIVHGSPVHGLLHPEMGHVALHRRAGDDAPSACPFHDACAEGLASGPAILSRYEATLSDLPPDHPAHDLVAFYIGQLCATLTLVASPRRIIIGGGVASTPGLHGRIARHMRERLGGYLDVPALFDDAFIRPPMLSPYSGLLGAVALACRDGNAPS